MPLSITSGTDARRTEAGETETTAARLILARSDPRQEQRRGTVNCLFV